MSENFLELTQRFITFNILPVIIPLAIAYGIHLIAVPIAKRLAPIGRLGRRQRTSEQREARKKTLISLIGGMISGIAFLVAVLAAIGSFVGVDSLIWLIGLFGAGIGFSAKPFIGDTMTGVMFIMDDDFDVGEKVEIVGIEGVVEEITLRTVTLRGMNGEEYTIPNGEIRTVRNFSRGRYTPVKVTVRVPSTKLRQSVRLLEHLGEDAMDELPNLLEPWRVIAEEVTMGQHTELTLLAKAKFGAGAEMRPRMLALVQENLETEGILLTD